MRLHLTSGILCGVVLFHAVALPKIHAQQTLLPGLHLRSDRNANEDNGRESGSGQTFTLPDDVSGAYHFTHYNDSIELDFDRKGRKKSVELSGYISRLGDNETDKNTALTFFFDKTSIDGSQFSFQTRVVHGVWYSFHGTIFRGDAQTRDQDGYYILHGTLIEHHPQGDDGKSADETIERRTVDFKSMGS